MPDNLPPRVDLLERLQAQQAHLNNQLIDVTARLGEAHALYAAALALHDARLAPHAEHMAMLDALLAAIKDLLACGNGHEEAPDGRPDA